MNFNEKQARLKEIIDQELHIDHDLDMQIRDAVLRWMSEFTRQYQEKIDRIIDYIEKEEQKEAELSYLDVKEEELDEK